MQNHEQISENTSLRSSNSNGHDVIRHSYDGSTDLNANNKRPEIPDYQKPFQPELYGLFSLESTNQIEELKSGKISPLPFCIEIRGEINKNQHALREAKNKLEEAKKKFQRDADRRNDDLKDLNGIKEEDKQISEIITKLRESQNEERNSQKFDLANNEGSGSEVLRWGGHESKIEHLERKQRDIRSKIEIIENKFKKAENKFKRLKDKVYECKLKEKFLKQTEDLLKEQFREYNKKQDGSSDQDPDETLSQALAEAEVKLRKEIANKLESAQKDYELLKQDDRKLREAFDAVKSEVFDFIKDNYTDNYTDYETLINNLSSIILKLEQLRDNPDQQQKYEKDINKQKNLLNMQLDDIEEKLNELGPEDHEQRTEFEKEIISTKSKIKQLGIIGELYRARYLLWKKHRLEVSEKWKPWQERWQQLLLQHSECCKKQKHLEKRIAEINECIQKLPFSKDNELQKNAEQFKKDFAVLIEDSCLDVVDISQKKNEKYASAYPKAEELLKLSSDYQKDHPLYPSEQFASDAVYSLRSNLKTGCGIYVTRWLLRYHGVEACNDEETITQQAAISLNGAVLSENIPGVFDSSNIDAQQVEHINTFNDIKEIYDKYGPFLLEISLFKDNGILDHLIAVTGYFEKDDQEYIAIADIRHPGGTQAVLYKDYRPFMRNEAIIVTPRSEEQPPTGD